MNKLLPVDFQLFSLSFARHAIFQGVFSLALFGTFPFAGQALAQDDAGRDPQKASENLQQIRIRLEKEERRLKDLQVHQAELQAQSQKLGSEATAASDKKKELEDKVAGLSSEAERLTRSVAQAKTNVENHQVNLKKRLVALYKTQRRTAALDYIFGARSSTDLLKRVRYLGVVAKYDKNYLSSLTKLVQSLTQDQNRLETVRGKQQEQLKQISLLESQLLDKKEKQGKVLAEEREKVKLQEKSLEKLRASAAKLEQMLASIMGGEKYQPSPDEKTPEEKEAPELPEVITHAGETTPPPSPVITTPYDGRGLDGMKGQLVVPVQGDVVQHFGKQRHEEFSDVLFIKGVEMKASVGTRVRAVAEGKVVLSQVLPGYGNVVIVDHGQRYYTLYGRLASSLKSVGQLVKKGEALAVLGEADYKGRNFYFELRVKGKAVDPATFIKEL